MLFGVFPKRKILIISLNLILVVLFCVIFFFANSLPEICLYEDEADYVYVVRKGFIANYMDSGTLPFTQFLKLGFSAITSQKSKTELSRIIRSADDISVYRHWHGPLYFYYLVTGKWIHKNQDHLIRMYSLMVQLFCAITVFAGFLFLLGYSNSITTFFLTALCVLGSTSLYFSTAILSTHGVFTLACIGCLFVLIKAVQSGKVMYYHISAGIMGVVFLSNEYAVLMMVTWVSSLLFAEMKRKVGFRKILRIFIVSMIIWLGVIFILWPASLLKFSLIKSYMTQAYFMVFRGSAFSPMPVWKYWISRFSALPFDMGISFSGLSLGLLILLRKRQYLFFPPVFYMTLVLLTTLRNQSLNPTYTVTFVVTGIITFGIALSTLPGLRSFYKTGLLSLMCILQIYYLTCKLFPEQKNILSPKTEIIRFLESEQPRNLLSVRYMIPIIRHYYPSIKVDSFTAEIYSHDEGLADVKRSIESGPEYDGMIFHGQYLSQYLEIIDDRYYFDPVSFGSENGVESWTYLRLKPRKNETVQM
ncbi:MAG: hypothetical protein GX089_07895 [Fibrobacter sp.]|jgi:hypothetical protein|nr:hypothetical protein [Fibrobacter sp.]